MTIAPTGDNDAFLLHGKSLAVYLPDLSGGGAERLHLNLASHFQAVGMKVTFVLDRKAGALVHAVPSGVNVEVLGAARQIAALPRLSKYLARSRPDLLLSNTEHANIIALWARRAAGVPTRVIVTQHNALSRQIMRKAPQWRALPFFYRRFINWADAIVAVSKGTGNELVKITGADPRKVTPIYNGVVADSPSRANLTQKSQTPTVVAVGRLVPQKDYPTLLRAFACLRGNARLQILGDGPGREELGELADQLGISRRIELTGFVQDPLSYMAAAHVCVLSSRFEGFGNVLAEALSCGTTCVSTDCPYGPSEILGQGAYGLLVPVGDHLALAAAIEKAIDHPLDSAKLQQWASQFSVSRCAANYLDLFARTLAGGQQPAMNLGQLQ